MQSLHKAFFLKRKLSSPNAFIGDPGNESKNERRLY